MINKSSFNSKGAQLAQRVLISSLVTLLLLTGCEPDAPTTLSLNKSALQMEVGDRATLEISPASDKVVWKSSDDKVATVFYGVVTATGAGMATITATVEQQSAECAVLVTGEAVIELTLLSDKSIEVQKGDSAQIKARTAIGRSIQWFSSDEQVATVSQTGLVKALSEGQAKITLYDGYTQLTVQVIVPKQIDGEYKLVWAEEFNGPELDMSTWTYETGGGGWGNRESQYYTSRKENIRIEDGKLIIQARKEKYENNDYTSARIKTQGKKSFTYGKIEARISLPKGGGSWPAFWMMGENYPTAHWPLCGELDIMEHVGNQPSMISYALHTSMKNGSRGNNWSARTNQDGIEGEYHVYGIRWEESEHFGCDRITFTFDGVDKATRLEELEHIDDPVYWPFNKPFFFILNVAVGGNFGGTIDPNAFNKDVMMKVDWIHVYQIETK